VLHRKNSWKFSVYLLDLKFLVHMPQVISKLSLAEHFFIWETENPSKIRPLSAVLFWQISTNICVCRFIALFFSSFDHGTFGEVATVVYTLYVVVLGWNLKQKGLIQCYAYTNIANRIVFSFVWRKFSSVGIGEWWDKMKNGQKLKLGDVTPRNTQEVQASKFRDAPEAPPSSSAKIRSPFKTLYFYCFMQYAFFLERQLFLFSVFFCFVCCNKWLDHIMFLLEEMNSLFICQEHSFFTLIVSTSVLFFCYCVWLAFFALIFVQILLYLFIKVYFCLWSLLVFIKRGIYNFFWMVLEKRKSFMQKKKWYQKELV
jgi:hypothetical protein